MAVTSLTLEAQVASIFLSYFQRAPENEAMAWYKTQLKELLEENDPETAYKLLSAQVYTDGVRHGEVPPPEGMSNAQYVNYIYLNVLGREADEEGFTWWLNALNDGEIERAELVGFVINSALDNGGRDAAYVSNRTEVAVEFSKWENSNPQILDDLEYNAAEVLEGVDERPESVEAAMARLYENSGELGRSYTLTLGKDEFTGGDGDDVFDAALDITVGGLVGAQTLQGQDILDGGGGHNVLNAELNNTGTSWDPTISNIQVYNLTSVSGVVGPILRGGQLDLLRASGYEELWNVNSRADLNIFNVETNEDGDAPLIGMRGVQGGTTFTVEYAGDVVVTEQNIVASNVGSNATGPATLDIWAGDFETIDTVNLEVSDGVRLILQRDANWATNLNIAGSGLLVLEGVDDFKFLENLDATGYEGDLILDISGSEDLETVTTGVGDDAILVSSVVLDGSIEIDLGEGTNILGVDSAHDDDVFYAAEISALDFNSVSNVQVLVIDDDVELDGDATLDFDGFDVAPGTLIFGEDLDGNGKTLTLANAAEDLVIEVDGNLDDLILDAGNVVNLVINGNEEDGRVDIDDVTGSSLESLSVNQNNGNGVIWLDIKADAGHDISQLRDLSAVAAGSAVVELKALNADEDNFDNLTNITVAAGGDAVLRLQGTEGVVEEIGQKQIDHITIAVTGGGFGGGGTAAGNIVFNSSSFPSGVISTSYSATGLEFPRSNWAALDVAGDLAAGSDGLFTATVPTLLGIPTSNVITVEWADYQEHEIGVFSQNATSGSLNPVSVVTVQDAVEPVAMQPGEGFEALETIEVIGGEDAIVELEDVYGSFFLDVTAGDDAWVDLWNTQAVSVTVTAGDWADIDVGGDTIGNWDLVDVTVDANDAWVTLEDALYSFWVLDVTNVDSYLYVDTEDAEFGLLATGEYITYLLGNTGDYDDLTVDVEFWGNLAARELYAFVGDDIQHVVINNFTAGADPVYGDRIDLSSFGYTNAGQLVFTIDGANLVITDLEGGIDGFSGSITIVGGAAAADDIALYNIIYA